MKTTYYAVMKAHSWGALEINGRKLQPQAHGPSHFVPLFESFPDAVKWAGGDENIFEMSTTDPESQ